jgi:hypothetical protein
MNTQKYSHWSKQLAQLKTDRYYCRAISTDEEAGELIEAGWTHVCNKPTTGRMLSGNPDEDSTMNQKATYSLKKHDIKFNRLSVQ